MNKIHNVIWSKAQNAWVVVAEGSKACTKAGSGALKVMIALILLSPAAGMAANLPQGGSISVGQGTISTNGSSQMVIKQTSGKLGINWQSFNVGADGHVIFDQPNSKSVALNRVIGSDGSSILGKIDANGQVFLINPNGVIFGKDAKVNVGGLVASTLNISDEDFRSGNYKLTAGAINGEVINNGSLQSAEGGYIALIGKSVKNNGLIKAQLGTAAMASGDAVTLDFSGDGLINIQVDKSAVKALVDNQGMIQADGGSVLMTARASNSALETVVNNDGIVQAQTINSKAGRIFLDGGPVDGEGIVAVSGKLDASAPGEGDGGFIDTSGKVVRVSDSAKITTLSATGKTGTWLIDPTDFQIATGSAAGTDSKIGARTLSDSLQTSNVEIKTQDYGTQAGNIFVNGEVSWSSNTQLTLTAHKNVELNNNINISGDGGLVITTNSAGANPGSSVIHASEVWLGTPGVPAQINLSGANSAYTENGIAYTVLRTADDLKAISGSTGGHYVLGTNIDASQSSTWNGGNGFQSIGSEGSAFSGVINGLGHNLTNLTIKAAGQNNVGLVGYADGATLSNLTLSGSVAGAKNVGLLAGAVKNTVITSVKTSGSVSATGDQAGGAIGFASDSTLSNLMSSATVTDTGSSSIGGLIGHASGITLTTALSSGAVTGLDGVGGLIGTLENSNITGGSSSSVVKGRDGVGGLIGTVTNGSVLSLVSYIGTNLAGANRVGGLIGSADGVQLDKAFVNVPGSNLIDATGNDIGGLIGSSKDGSYQHAYSRGRVKGVNNVGGLIGRSEHDVISESFSVENVTGATAVGGLIGNSLNSTITDAYASAFAMAPPTNYNAYYGVIGTDSVGGLIGSTQNTQVDRVYSTGIVSPATNQGGLVGSDLGGNTVGSAFWNMTASGINASALGVGKTDAQMNDVATFAGWSVATDSATQSPWRIYQGSTLPLLTFLMPKASISPTASVSTTYTGYAISRVYPASYSFSGITPKDNGFWGAANTYSYPTYSITYGGNKIIDAGIYTLDPMYSNQFSYNFDQNNTTTLTVNRATLSLNRVFDKTYDGTTDVALGSYFGLGADRGDSSLLTATWNPTSFSSKNAGDYTLNLDNFVLSGSSAKNYIVSGSYTVAATIDTRLLNVDVNAISKTYDGTTAATVSYSRDDRVVGDDLIIDLGDAYFGNKNAGTDKVVNVDMTLSGSDASNYYTYGASGVADINRANLAIIATGADKTYDGTTDATVTLSNSKIAGDKVTVDYDSVAFTDKNAGVGKEFFVSGIYVSGKDARNYDWDESVTGTADIAKANLVIGATGVNKTYDGTTAGSAVFSDNRIGSDLLSISGDAFFSDKNAGVGKAVSISGINVTGSDASNYTWNTTTSANASIAKAILGISALGVNKTYDGSTSASISLSDDRVSGDNLSISSTSSFSDKNAGEEKLVTVSGINVTGADANNYNWVTSATGTADITAKKISVDAVAADKTYDAATWASVDLSTSGIVVGDKVTLSGEASFSDKNAGIGKTVTVDSVTIGGADGGNYQVETSGGPALTTATINKADLMISGVGQNKIYDGTTAADVSFGWAPAFMDEVYVQGSAVFGDKNAGAGKAISVTNLDVYGADAGNYVWAVPTSVSAEIIARPINIDVTGVDKTYDGTKSASVGMSATTIPEDPSISGLIAGDDLQLSGTASFADKNAGTSKVVTVDSVTLGGLDGKNYQIAYPEDTLQTTATINKANLNVSGLASDKVYDGSTLATGSVTAHQVAGDDVVVGFGSATFTDKNAGLGKVVTFNGLNVTGADASNYTWATSASSTADISKATLNVSASGHDKVYDGNTGAGITLADNRIGSDELTISAGSTAFSDKNAGSGKAVSVGGITVAGADAGNYVWNSVASTTANIFKALLNISATAQNKSYDGTDHASLTLADNRIAGDNLTATAGSSVFSDKNAGSSKNVSVSGINLSGADAANYTFNTSAATTADVSKASLTVKANSSGKVEGAADGTLSWSLQNGNLYGSDVLSGALARDSGEIKGVYGIGKGTLSAGNNYDLTVVPGKFEITKASTVPPVVVPPVVVDPKPVVTPEETKALETTKQIISTITVATKQAATSTAAAEPAKANQADASAVINDYRLLNLGMKLPDEIFADDSSKK